MVAGLVELANTGLSISPILKNFNIIKFKTVMPQPKYKKDHWLCRCGILNYFDRKTCLGCRKNKPKKPKMVRGESPYDVKHTMGLEPIGT